MKADQEKHRKQRHTARRIFERLRDEYGYTGGYTVVKDVVREHEVRHREMFVPLVHPPGNAQVDFGEGVVVVDGVEQKGHFLAMDLPHSDAPFVMIFPKETTEAFCLGHAEAFAWFGGVPRTILYDNTAIAVARILDTGERQRTQVFDQLISHYLFHDRFARVGKGNDSVAVRRSGKPGAVKLAPQGTAVPFTYEGGRVRFTVPKLVCHQMVELAD